MDDTLDTLDTSLDHTALDLATEVEDALDTEQIPALESAEELPPSFPEGI